MLSLPSSIVVVDVAARDGLQSFHRWVETATKIRMVDRLSEAGFSTIEVTNFAHPRMIPHLCDAEAVMEGIRRRPGTIYRVQAPNPRGATRAVATNPGEILGLITASETYNLKNQNMTLAQGVDAAIETFRIADAASVPFLLAIGMAYWCAYDGRVPEERVLDMIGRFRNGGIRRFYLAGSLGMEDPVHVHDLIAAALDRFADIEIGFHAHNLSGNAPANILAAMAAGASFIEGSICGIGGGIRTPGHLGSIGNYATEDIVHMMNEMGVDTGLSTRAVLDAARDVALLLDITPESYVTRSGTRDEILDLERARSALTS